MTEIISIANKKGGVAKTTTAINLAYSLTQEEFGSNSVLLIDLDSQGNATSGINFDSDIQDEIEQQKDGLYKIFTEKLPLLYGVYESDFHNLDIIPATPSLEKVKNILVNEIQSELFLKKALDKCIKEVEENYDYIIIDNNPSLGSLVYNSLAISDYVIIPVIPKRFSIDGITQMYKAIKEIKMLNNKLKILGILIVNVDVRTNFEKDFKKRTGNLPLNLFETVIAQNADVGYSQNKGIPILKYNPKAKGAKQYVELTKEILGRIEDFKGGMTNG